MTTAIINVPLPIDLYQRLEQMAVYQAKSVETVLSETLQVLLPAQTRIPLAIQQEIDRLDLLPTETLSKVAVKDMADEDQAALEQLLDWQNMRLLIQEEQTKLAALQTEYGRVLLRKARAFAILVERGHPLPL